MSDKKAYIRSELFGQINHYNEKGWKVGESRPGIFDGFTEYDASMNCSVVSSDRC